MNIFGFSALLVGITSFSMTLLHFIKGRNSKLNIIWGFYTLSVAIWGFGGFKISTLRDYDTAFFWWQITYIGIIFIPILFLHFVCVFLALNRKKLIIFSYFLTLLFIIFDLFNKKLFIGDLKFLFNQFYWVNPPGILLHTFIFYSILGLIGYSQYLLIKRLYIETNSSKKVQIKYFLVGSALSWSGGFLCFLPCYGIYLYPLGNFTILIYPVVFTYAIVKYRLMDIKVAITRAGVFIAVYTLVLGIPFAVAIWLKPWLVELFQSNWWLVSFGMLGILATAGPFIYIYIDRRAENRLLREQRRYQNTLKQASIGMTRIRNLRRLLELIVHIVTKTVRISYAAVYLYDESVDKYVLQVSRDKGRVPISSVETDNTLINWIVVKREPILYEEVKRQMEDTNDATYKHLEESMRLLTAMVVIPSFLEDKFIGFIVLGEKVSGAIYTPDDLNVFQVLASQAALAIENAQFYEEAKEMQEQIAQAEKMATVGTMADGLSHQINNRFYALSLIAGDTIDTIKMMDTSKCTPEIKKMIDEINHALGRIQANVIQGGEVVKGILKYTRKGEEGFEALSLDQILDGTLEMVQYKVKLSEIDIVRDYAKDIPKIKGNIVQLQEAFFNFIDNGYDATVERKTTFKEDGYRGKITIAAQTKDKVLEITVSDNGMGVKDDNLKKIFTPFFTTKTSSHKGTGLGLYVIKRIITDLHKGTINFESAYKVGTRFIITLPIAE